MTRASSRAGIARGSNISAGDVSGALTGVVIRYVRQRVGNSGVKQLLDGAGDFRSIQTLENPTSWSSIDQTIALFDSAARILRDPDVALHLGEEVLGQFKGTQVADLLLATKSPGGLLRAAVASFGRLSPMTVVEVLETHDNRAVVLTSARRGFSRHVYMCDFEKGFLAEVPTFFGASRASVTETECQARGGRSCRYLVEWATDALATQIPIDKDDARPSEVERRLPTDAPGDEVPEYEPVEPRARGLRTRAPGIEDSDCRAARCLGKARSAGGEVVRTPR